MTLLQTQYTDRSPDGSPEVATTRAPDRPSDTNWFLRVNPFGRRTLPTTTATAAVDRLLRADAALDAATARCAEELYALVGTSTGEARKTLLATRRAIVRGKRPADAGHECVQRWSIALQERDAAEQAVLEGHAEAVREERMRLSEALQDEHLHKSLQLVAPEVGAQAERYCETVGVDGTGPARLLKAERGLLQYVLRAAARTSPLSQLTAAGLTADRPGGTDPARAALEGVRAHFGLDRVMLSYVVAGALRRAGAEGADPLVGLPPTCAVTADQLLFLRPTDQGYQRVGARRTGLIAAAVHVLALGPMSRSALVDALTERLGTDAESATQHLDRLIDQGALTTFEPIDEDPRVDLAPRGVPELDGLLGMIASSLRSLEVATVEHRPALIARTQDALAQLSRYAGRPARVAVNEDFVAEPTPIDSTHWTERLHDLGTAVELLHIFDWLGDVVVAMADGFVRRYGEGACVPLTECAPELVADVTAAAQIMTQQYARTEDLSIDDSAFGPDGTLAALYRLRRAVEGELHEQLGRAVDEGQDAVEISPELIRRWTDAIPTRLARRPLSYGVLVQDWDGHLVVNDGLPGHGILYSRFLGIQHEGQSPTESSAGAAGLRLRQRVERLYARPGVRTVEDRSAHGLNVNVHPPVLTHPLEPADWSGLRLQHDPDQGRLDVVDAHGPVQVLPIGGGHPGQYPDALSVASGLVIAGRLYNGIPDTFAKNDERDCATTRFVPALHVGSVIISRRRWYPGDDLKQALDISDDAERLVAVNRWRAAHDVPAQVFVKSPPADSGPATVGEPDAQDVRFRSKPQYVDLTSALCVRVLPRLLDRRAGARSDEFYIEEAGPSVQSDTHATEWVIEIDRRADGSFSYGGQ